MVGADAHVLKLSLESDGVAFVRAVPRERALDTGDAADAAIARLAAEVSRPLETYLRSASVWRCRSPVVEQVRELLGPLRDLVGAVLERDVTTTRTSVIRKSGLSPQATPWHQDAPYARREPYVVSTWLALDDADEASGALRFLPGSHRGPPSPKTDYWRPDFEDKPPTTTTAEVSFPVMAGDVLIFDPLVWHASHPCVSGRRRLAVSTRWTWPAYAWPYELPASPEVEFGMSNAARVTDDILRRAHGCLFGPAPREQRDLVTAWSALLANEHLDGIEPTTARDALMRLATLDLAHRLHDAGDQEGQVYLDVWRTLLAPLKRIMESRRAS